MIQHRTFPTDDQIYPDGPVECLGMTFPNDEARRAYFLAKLREKLQDPAFRQIEGFPIGTDEDILALSDPPYYTACPNPFIEDFIAHYETPYDPSDSYHKEPFAADVSEGKNDPIYNAHSYHTKVPHKAIMRYILHYTEPDDIVLDGFCGTGMTGVAAQMCANPEPEFKLQVEHEWNEAGWGKPQWGVRRAVLSDLSPAATFIAYNYNNRVDVHSFEREARRILVEVEKECGWMYETTHTDGSKGRINYTVWGDVFVCPECSAELVFWDVAVDKKQGKVLDVFPCPQCEVQLTKTKLERVWVNDFDTLIMEPVRHTKQTPVIIDYSVPGLKGRFMKQPDNNDLILIRRIDEGKIPYWFPTNRVPKGDKTSDPFSIGITHAHHFYTKRNLWVLSALRQAAFESRNVTGMIMFWVGAANRYLSRLSKLGTEYYFHGGGGAVNAGVLGTLYVPSFSVESSVQKTLDVRLPKLLRVISTLPSHSTSSETRSSTELSIKNDSVDYIFTDPPFGSNLMYSELI